MSAGPYSIGSNKWPGLSKLIEEAGEVVQVAGKIIATNGEAAHWDGSDLRVRLIEELADLRAAIDFVVAENALNFDMARVRQKYERFRTWHAEQSKPTTGEEIRALARFEAARRAAHDRLLNGGPVVVTTKTRQCQCPECIKPTTGEEKKV